MKSESRLPNTFLRNATANRFSWSFRSICYCGSAMGVTHSCECIRKLRPSNSRCQPKFRYRLAAKSAGPLYPQKRTNGQMCRYVCFVPKELDGQLYGNDCLGAETNPL